MNLLPLIRAKGKVKVCHYSPTRGIAPALLNGMQVFVNNSEKTVSEETSLSILLEQERLLSAKGIAVAVNGEVIPKNAWAGYKLPPGSRILIIKAAQGG